MKQTETEKPTGRFARAKTATKKYFQDSDSGFWGTMILWFVLALILLFFIGVMFSECVSTIVSDLLGIQEAKDETSKHKTLKFIGLGMSGILVSIGAIAINRRASAQERENELVEKGHINDRFQHATQNLGDNQSAVRIAAFYQFYYLAKKGKEEFGKSIFEILCSYLRSMPRKKSHLKKKDEETRPTVECEILLNILFQPKYHDVFDKLHKSKPYLRRVFLVNAQLPGAILSRAILSRANLSNANLSHANLSHANLSDANLSNANLSDANLSDAILSRANLSEANLLSVNLSGVKFLGADLSHTILANVTFSNADLSGVKFLSAELSHADFSRAKLANANFSNANLSDAILSLADLSRADLSDANLSDAILLNA